jgi:hypothetical protein
MLSLKPEQRTQEVRAIPQVRGLVVDYFDLVALQYGDIHELFGFFVAAVLNDQETRGDHFKHGTGCRKVASSAPNEELRIVAPDAKVNAWSLHSGSKPRQGLRRKRQPPLERQGPSHAFR